MRPVVFGNKTRRGHDEKAEMLDIVGQVEGKNVLIVDDFTISGGTLIEMADRLQEARLRRTSTPAFRTVSSRAGRPPRSSRARSRNWC